MLRNVLPLVMVLYAGSLGFAAEERSTEDTVQFSHDSTADTNSDWAPGDETEPPACTSMDQVGTVDCTATPDTPAHEPAEAPDSCIDWGYDDFWGDFYDCA